MNKSVCHTIGSIIENQIGGGGLKPSPHGEYCDLVTVAFNNSDFVKYQIKALNKNFIYPFRYTVFDNSTREEIAKEIEEICHQENVGYIRLPKQDSFYSATSHAIALNYLWRNYYSKSDARYYGILDHDIFPLSNFDISEHIIGQPIFGFLKDNKIQQLQMGQAYKGAWFMWPGFSFFDMDYLRTNGYVAKLDFGRDMLRDLDTGGKNYKILYKHLKLSKLRRANSDFIKLDQSAGSFWSGYEQYNCGWIHMWNGSGYLKMSEEIWNRKYQGFMDILHREFD